MQGLPPSLALTLWPRSSQVPLPECWCHLVLRGVVPRLRVRVRLFALLLVKTVPGRQAGLPVSAGRPGLLWLRLRLAARPGLREALLLGLGSAFPGTSGAEVGVRSPVGESPLAAGLPCGSRGPR